uniref:Uncharacterized protein LOC116951995 n=1 Tax=Petromyzon marinus TaxID=7757 RepID=A0AAJ7X9U2_PETMA|nr:uncharacterized protein LOC116951995 [Petromyzon marinus]
MCKTTLEDILDSNKQDVAVDEPKMSPFFTVSGLSIVSFRVLQVIVYALLICSDNFQSNEGIAERIKKWKVQFDASWNILKYLCLGLDRNVCKLLHSVIKNSKLFLSTEYPFNNQIERYTFPGHELEKSFDEIVQKVVENLGFVFYEEHSLFSICNNEESIESQMHTAFTLLNKTNKQSQANLLRASSLPSVDSLVSSLTMKIASKNIQHQFLLLVCKYRRRLECLKHLFPILSWTNMLKDNINYKISKLDSDKYSISLIFEGNYFKVDEHTKMTYDMFQEAWNTLRANEEFKDLNLVLMTKENKISSCLFNCSSELEMLVQKLMSFQNSFLMEVLNISLTSTCFAIHMLKKNEFTSAISYTTIFQAKKHEIIDFKWDNDILKHSECSTKLGYGNLVFYDFSTIEIELSKKLILGKSFLQVGNDYSINFLEEVLLCNYYLLDEIRQKIKQLPIPKGYTDIIKEKSNTSIDTIKQLHNVIEILLSLLKRTEGNSLQPLKEYIAAFSRFLPHEHEKYLIPETEEILKLHHIVSLYETIEDNLSDSAKGYLNSEFKIHLNEHSKKLLEDMASNEDVVFIKNKLKVLKKYAYRYYRSQGCTYKNIKLDKSLQNAIEPLEKHVFIGSQSNTGENKVVFKIPEDINIEHMYDVITLLERILKDKEYVIIPVMTQRKKFRKF